MKVQSGKLNLPFGVAQLVDATVNQDVGFESSHRANGTKPQARHPANLECNGSAAGEQFESHQDLLRAIGEAFRYTGPPGTGGIFPVSRWRLKHSDIAHRHMSWPFSPGSWRA